MFPSWIICSAKSSLEWLQDQDKWCGALIWAPNSSRFNLVRMKRGPIQYQTGGFNVAADRCASDAAQYWTKQLTDLNHSLWWWKNPEIWGVFTPGNLNQIQQMFTKWWYIYGHIAHPLWQVLCDTWRHWGACTKRRFKVLTVTSNPDHSTFVGLLQTSLLQSSVTITKCSANYDYLVPQWSRKDPEVTSCHF